MLFFAFEEPDCFLSKDVKELPEVVYVPIQKCFVPNPLVSFRFFGKKGLL